jgi:hypothetical protein
MPKAMAPTDRQLEVLGYIQVYADFYGTAPTRTQIARDFGITPAAAGAHVRCLRKWQLLLVDKATRQIALPRQRRVRATRQH